MSVATMAKKSMISKIGALFPVLQPIVPLPWSGEKKVLHEVLARIRTHDGIVLHPIEFMDGPVTTDELDLAMLVRIPVLQSMHPDLTLTLNAAPASFCNPVYLQTIKTMVLQKEIVPARLIIEITEDSTDTTLDMLILDCSEQVRALGIQIALDDFGSGGNGIARLAAGTFDIIKICTGIDIVSTRGKIIIESVVEIAEKISVAGINGRQMKVVLEGVETEEQFVAANRMNINYVQGYLLGLPREEALAKGDALNRASSLLAGNLVFL